MISDNFTGSKIFLIDDSILNDLENKLIINDDIKNDNFNSFYTNYIESNQFAIIVIFLIFIYLYIKYILKKDKDDTENLISLTNQVDNDIKNIKKKKNKKNKLISNKNNNEYSNANINDIKNLNENFIDDEYTIDDNEEYDENNDSIDSLYGQDEFISNNFIIEQKKASQNKNNLDALTNIIFNEN